MLPSFPKQEQRPQVAEHAGATDLGPRELAAVLVDQALILWGPAGESKAVAALLEVDESLVRKWRRGDERACPNLIQLLTLGPEFMGLLLKCEGRYRGRGRAAVLAALEAIGEIAWLQE
jgi:hypothetical protein